MKRLNGNITERLMSMFGGHSTGWNPGRPGDHPPTGGKLHKGVSGTQAGGKPGRRKKP
jgi:hypothetical protein